MLDYFCTYKVKFKAIEFFSKHFNYTAFNNDKKAEIWYTIYVMHVVQHDFI